MRGSCRHRDRGPGRAGRRIKRFFTDQGGGLYRSRHGMIMGVCRGLAEYFDIRVLWIRLLCVVVLLFSGLWPMIGIYVIASLIMKPEPVTPLESDDEKDFYDNYVASRQGAIRTLKTRFDALDRRIRRMEETVTDREFDWDRRFNAS